MATASTAKDLLAQGLRPTTPYDRLRNAALRKYEAARKEGRSEDEALQAVFPNTLLDTSTLRTTLSALVAGTHILLLGPPGSGKTNLAKDIWALMPKEAIVVADCPVQDDPFSLIDAKWAQYAPPCPYCKTRYGQVGDDRLHEFDASKVDAAKVPVRAAQLREGYGLARIQGSPEVFPDNLTGAINISKLEEVGDPNSPLVMEPGKVLQANRGLLMIDEVGKLPRGTQNVLLQALQERIVTPAKSRETFPASFVAVATSNLQDLDNITEPLIGRLGIVYVGFNESHEKNVQIIRSAASDGANAFASRLFQDAAAGLAQSWRRTAAATDDLGEVGSNRTMIDIVRRAEAHAILSGRDQVEAEDFEAGAKDAMTGRIRARGAESFEQNLEVVTAFLSKRTQPSLKEAAVRYWCAYYIGQLGEDKAEGLRTVDAVEAHTTGKAADAAKVEKFRKFVADYESRDGTDADALLKDTYRRLKQLDAFAESAKA